ncbi:MAG: cell division ATP-binding protein FtsE [Gammaproteobacteria bacterium]|nr:cell division ATP-binding protein FtsE [Gammaproteobacteria bacterium]
MALIQLSNVGKRYEGGYDALRAITMHIDAGEMVFLTGRSGAGKSTLLKLLALIDRSTQGTVIVNGKNYNHVKPGQIPYIRREIGMIFQNHRLLQDRSVFDNVALPLLIHGYNRNEIQRRVRAALDKVGLLKKERLRPLMLSGGEQQRVGIARAVVNKPLLLLADEPTGNLDPELSSEIMRLFREFNQVGVTVLVASHDLDLIRRFGCRMVTLDNGELLNDTGTLMTSPELERHLEGLPDV